MPNLGTPSRWGTPKWGPKPHSYIGGSDGRQCDLAHITLPRGPQNGVPRTPKIGGLAGPLFGGFWLICSRFSRVYSKWGSPGGAQIQGPNPQKGVQNRAPNPIVTLVVQTGVNVISAISPVPGGLKKGVQNGVFWTPILGLPRQVDMG